MSTTSPRSGGDDPRQGRVAAVHAHARLGLGLAGAFAVAAVAAAVVAREVWLPLHLFVVGALLSAIGTVTVMLAVTWSAAPAPPTTVAVAQLGLVAAGTVALTVGREGGHARLVELGGAGVVAGLAVLAGVLVAVRRAGTVARFRPAIDAYVTAVGFGIVGVILGTVVATGGGGDRWSALRATHLTLNVFGLVGLVVAGTLPYFVATQARLKMARTATPGAVRATTALLAAAAAAAGVGRLAESKATTAAALTVYAAGVVVLATRCLPRPGRRQFAWAGPRLWQLFAGLTWWTAMTVALAVQVASGGDEEDVLVALAVGGLAQILSASVAYLVPVVRAGGHERLSAGFTTTRSWVALGAGNVAGAAALGGWRGVLTVALVVWVADAAWRGARLAAWRRRARPRPLRVQGGPPRGVRSR